MKNLRIMGSGELRVLNHILFEYKKFNLWESSIILGYRGSITHGTYLKGGKFDDKDIMGIAIAPMDYYLGLQNFEQFERLPSETDPWDIVIYEFKKYINLLIKSNPNVLALLWLPKKFYLKVSPLGQLLIDNRNLFVSKQAYHSFSGYAYSQLHKMTPEKVTGRMGDKRKELVSKFGYDVKNASHLIRLLKMGIEFLVEGELFIERKDANQLIEIKRGEWKLNKVLKLADNLFAQCKDAYIHSALPAKPDIESINLLAHQIMKSYFIS